MTTIRSMTGFATASAPLGDSRISVDIKSINHRFLDISVRLPQGGEAVESKIQQRVREKLSRGRIEVSVTRPTSTKSGGSPLFSFQKELFATAFSSLSNELNSTVRNDGERAKIVARLLLSRSEILSFGESTSLPEAAVLEKSVDAAVSEALTKLISMRETEGAALVLHLRSHLGGVAGFIEQVKPLVAESVQRFKERVNTRIKNADLAVSEERVAAEVALLADRTDVTEELERLGSHVAQFQELLAAGGEIGKKLDFLTQEMAREVNTVGSKSQHPQISRLVVDTKAAIEKVREQIQNIE